MVHVSSKKMVPWSKHTNYACIVGERSPSEVGQGTMVTIKNVDKDLNDRRNTLTKLERKSMILLDVQRKELEKSMLKYTDKVREIRDSRTNHIFREIHTRQSQRHSLSDTRSLTQSIESLDACSLPVDSANIRKRRKRLQGPRRSMFPPIVEHASRNGKRNSLPSPNSSEYKEHHVTKTKRRDNKKDSSSEQNNMLDNNSNPILTSRNVQIEINIDTAHLDDIPTSVSKAKSHNPAISIELDTDNSTMSEVDTGTTDAVDSAYGSAVDLHDEEEDRDNSCETQAPLVNSRKEEQYLLTLPKIHKRRSLVQSSES